MRQLLTDEYLVPVAREVNECLAEEPAQDGFALARKFLRERNLTAGEPEEYNYAGRVLALARMLRESEDQLSDPAFQEALRQYRARQRRPRRRK